MAGTHQNQRQVLSFYTSGKRADDRHGLSNQVGAIVKRNEEATRLARASTARKVVPMAKALLTSRYTIPPSYLTNRVSVRLDGETLRVDASILRFPLSLFSGRWGGPKTPGATASILQARTVTYQGAFMAGGRFRGAQIPLIYTRIKGKQVVMRSGRYAGKKREALVVNRGPSTYDMLLGFERDQQGNSVRNDAGDLKGALSASLVSFYISEQRRLRAAGVTGG